MATPTAAPQRSPADAAFVARLDPVADNPAPSQDRRVRRPAMMSAVNRESSISKGISGGSALRDRRGVVSRRETRRAATWASIAFAAACGLFLPCHAAQPERVVANHTVVSQRDPAITIKLPGTARYVGADRFLLRDREHGDFDDCELHAFVEADGARNVRRLYWVQFEAYLPTQPSLQHTYDSPRHVTVGGLDFYVDTWVSPGRATSEPGSDAEHLESLLAAHGYRRDDSMSVRLVHLTDSTRRKELMIIYSESLAATGYTAANLKAGGPAHAQWSALEAGLIQGAVKSLSIAPAGASIR